ncbi:hypothetical protein SAMN05661091_0123 [Paenibacillus uliginis N3/975]|uniref:Uncharacterized protein n=1 Tax=Paenibacillus uliginis N3/975 TaxID=1313296 RepID=A0A1X7G6P2_9BACL|nr:hypothetical protein [Paenibacillus uliginis]SMF64978.1 hypothetical protein SAMN05661091_0123 [Paenibacillus uliginis N3/975]
MAKITDSLPQLTEHKLHETMIRYMEIFRFDGNSAEQDIPWNDKSTNCGLFKISCSGASGYAEYALPDTREYADLVRWSSVFMRLKGLTVAEAISTVQKQQWGAVRTMLAESALKDLSANLIQCNERQRLGSLPLERSFLIDCSRAYFLF